MKVESRWNYIFFSFPTFACLHKKMSEEWAGLEESEESDFLLFYYAISNHTLQIQWEHSLSLSRPSQSRSFPTAPDSAFSPTPVP